jgi:hypothetical protein
MSRVERRFVSDLESSDIEIPEKPEGMELEGLIPGKLLGM